MNVLEILENEEIKKELEKYCIIRDGNLEIEVYKDYTDDEYLEEKALECIQEGKNMKESVEELEGELFDSYTDYTNELFECINSLEIDEEDKEILKDNVYLNFNNFLEYFKNCEIETTCIFATKEDLNYELCKYEFINKYFKKYKKRIDKNEYGYCFATQLITTLQEINDIQKHKKVRIKGVGTLYRPFAGGSVDISIDDNDIEFDINVKPCHLVFSGYYFYQMNEVYGGTGIFSSKIKETKEV